MCLPSPSLREIRRESSGHSRLKNASDMQTKPTRGKIIVFGILFWYPLAGVTFQLLHYLIALRRLGYDPYYIEDSGRWIYDPRLNDLSPDPTGNLAAVVPVLDQHGFGSLFWYPLAGGTFQFLHYLIALRRLGYEPYYIEDSGRWIYDPRLNDLSPDPTGNLAAVVPVLEQHGFGERWAFRGKYPEGK